MSSVPENGGYRVFLLPRGYNDYLTSSNPLPVGAVIVYYCDSGFSVVGDWKRHCQSDGLWNVLNMAPQSDLDQRFPQVVDLDMLTSPGLAKFFSDNKTVTFRTRGDFVLDELRLFTELHKEDYSLKMSVEAKNRSFTTDFSVNSSFIIDFDDPIRYSLPLQVPGEKPLTVKKVKLRLIKHGDQRHTSIWNPMEIQLVSRETGLSVARCQKDVEGREGFTKSWADRADCFHLTTLQMSSIEAERFCRKQGPGSKLVHLNSSLLLEQMEAYLRYNYKKENGVWWLSDVFNSSTNKWMREDLGPNKCLVLGKHDSQFQIYNVSCQIKALPICQAPPLSCASPSGVLERLRIGVDAFIHGTILKVHAEDELKTIRCVLGKWEDHQPGVTLAERVRANLPQLEAAGNSWGMAVLIVFICLILVLLLFVARRRIVKRRRKTNHFM